MGWSGTGQAGTVQAGMVQALMGDGSRVVIGWAVMVGW
jgi:hypothetical protein